MLDLHGLLPTDSLQLHLLIEGDQSEVYIDCGMQEGPCQPMGLEGKQCNGKVEVLLSPAHGMPEVERTRNEQQEMIEW